MGVQVDETGCDDQAVRIDDAFRRSAGVSAHRNHEAVLYRDVAYEARRAPAVDDRSSPDNDIIGTHRGGLPARVA